MYIRTYYTHGKLNVNVIPATTYVYVYTYIRGCNVNTIDVCIFKSFRFRRKTYALAAINENIRRKTTIPYVRIHMFQLI